MSIESNDININYFRLKLELSESYSEIIEEKINLISLKPGEKLNEFGEYVPGIFLIKEGTLRVKFKTFDNKILTINKYAKGEIAGKMQFLTASLNFSLAASTKVKGYLLSFLTASIFIILLVL